MPPQVRTLDQLVAESNSIYDPQRQNLQSQINTAGQRQVAGEQALGAAQTNAFQDITQASTRRGALFSGFTPDQQARYTAEKYLPALANLRAANEQTVQGLNQGILDLNADQRKVATATRENDLSKLYDYEQKQEERRFQTEQANLAYQREMERLQKEQAFTASQNAASRSAAAGAKAPTFGEAANSMFGEISKKVGSDGFVSPTTWAKAKSLWISNGYTSDQFNKTFSSFKNPKNPYYK